VGQAQVSDLEEVARGWREWEDREVFICPTSRKDIGPEVVDQGMHQPSEQRRSGCIWLGCAAQFVRGSGVVIQRLWSS